MGPRSIDITNRIPFTVATLDSLPTTRPIELSDEDTPSLKVRVSERGTKSLSMVYRSPVDQKRRRLTFGRYEGRSKFERKQILDDARKRLAEARLMLQAKRDPKLEAELERARQRDELDRLHKRKAEAEQTFESVAQEFLDSNDCPRASWDETRRAIEWHWLTSHGAVQPIGPRPITELRVPDLIRRIDQLRDQGKDGAAREAKKHLSRVFAFATRMGYTIGNPVSAIQLKGLRKSRARALSEDELGAAWAATSVLSEPWRQAFRMFVVTALRRNELLEARWGEISSCESWLDIPADRMKMDRPVRVALCELAQIELSSLHGSRIARLPIFTCDPSGIRPARGIYKPRDVWCAEIDRLLDIEGTTFRIHDLRHTAKTHLTKLGIPDDVSEAILGHQKAGMRAIYDHYPYAEESRDALEAYSTHILELARPFQR